MDNDAESSKPADTEQADATQKFALPVEPPVEPSLGPESNEAPVGLKAFVIGATGGVGTELVKQLAFTSNFEKITLLVRRDVVFDEYISNRVEQKVVDFDKIEEYKDAVKDHHVGYCCLGTTRAKVGVEGFKKVDHDYIVNSAKLAAETGCGQFHLCSSRGADEKSRLLYLNVKGKVEREISEMEFPLVFLYRPALLLCDRQERRVAESAFRFLLKPITYFWPTAMTVPGEFVAKAMVNVTLAPGLAQRTPNQKVNILENKDIHKLASSN